MSGNHESSREIIVVGPQLLIFEDKNRKLLEMDSFLPSHTYLESCQTIKFEEKILATLGDALSNLIFYLLLPQIENEITSCMIHLCFVFPSKLYHLYIRQEACMVWQLSSQACLVDQQICRLVFCGLAKRSWCIASKKNDVQKILETKLSILVASFSTSIQSATNYVVTYLQIPYSLKIFKNPLMILSINLKLLQN